MSEATADPTLRPLLAVDTGSPIVSVAVGPPGRVMASRHVEQMGSSEALLGLIEEVLQECALEKHHLGGLLALRGPGSFTGLRVGLASILGLHQALGIPATALPTLEVLAAAAQGGARVLAVVDALRRQWFAQPFSAGPAPEALSEARIEAAAGLVGQQPDVVVGFGVANLGEQFDWPAAVSLQEPGPLAPTVLELAAHRRVEWLPEALVEPLYLRAPAATPARR